MIWAEEPVTTRGIAQPITLLEYYSMAAAAIGIN